MVGNVTHLDTKSFNNTINNYTVYIKTFENIVKSTNSAIDEVIKNWQGEGAKAFEKDCKQVQLNLKDIADIMYDLRDALIDAHAEYLKTDEALSKNFDS